MKKLDLLHMEYLQGNPKKRNAISTITFVRYLHYTTSALD